MKKCIFILVYFGNFNNYFPLFLNSCKYNKDYDWLIITDNKEEYDFPPNCNRILMDLDKFNEIATSKIGIKINIKRPYKLCDFKPAYGLIFEEYIKEYMYWGHCDCDLIFGDLNKLLNPILEKNYDKIFAAGHLSVYRNTKEINNLIFFPIDGEEVYKKVFSSDDIYVFDEDYNTENNFRKNIHTIFINENKKIYDIDHSLNPKINSAKFINMVYLKEKRNFIVQKYIPQRYFWDNGKIFSIDRKGITTEYLYAHFQMRKMRYKIKNVNYKIIEFLPDRFVGRKKEIKKLSFLKRIFIGFPYLFWFDYYIRKIKRIWRRRKKCQRF